MSNNSFQFGNEFAEFIKSIFPEAKEASGGKELVVRCKYCSDSKDINHGHMYIHVPQDNTDVPTFHCFKCQTSGVVNSRSLIEWGAYNPLIGNEIDKQITKASKSSKFKGYNAIRYKFVSAVRDIQLSQRKMQYIKQRIGIELDLQEYLKQKIILNLKDSLDYPYNQIQQYTRHINIVNQLNDNFVGFLSLDNNFVNLRRIVPEGIVYSGIDKRYINYNIHNKQDNTEKMYIMPATIDLTIPQKVQIHIAEGPFDILSIRYNLRRNEPGIFAAVTGSGYKGLVMHLINIYQLFYFDLHIYPDNDKFGSDNNMREIAEYIRPYGANLYIHRNIFNGEKDFGVTPDRIIESINLLS